MIDRLESLYSLLALPVDYDLLCYTPTEWEQIKHQPFWRQAREGELVLYERE